MCLNGFGMLGNRRGLGFRVSGLGVSSGKSPAVFPVPSDRGDPSLYTRFRV